MFLINCYWALRTCIVQNYAALQYRILSSEFTYRMLTTTCHGPMSERSEIVIAKSYIILSAHEPAGTYAHQTIFDR